jgi:phosphohistidine phosphatase
MQRLILFRHAKAERQAASGEDFDRGLTDRGCDDAKLMGRVLNDAGLKPDVAWISPSKRTRETWEEAAQAFGPVETIFDRKLYLGSAKTMRRLIEPEEGRPGALMLVGHNPGLHQLVTELLVEGAAAPSVIARATAKFPTASVAAFDMDPAGRPVLEGLYYPADYGGGAGE